MKATPNAEVPEHVAARMAAAEAADGVEGWLSPAEGRILFDLASGVPADRAIVEIGSWKGKSTIWLARGAQAGQGARVYAVDPHTGSSTGEERLRQQPNGEPIWSFGQFKRNLAAAGVSDSVVPIVAFSVAAAREFRTPVGFLFIDGDHTYEAVKEDLESWLPHVVEGGTVAFHDTNIPVYPGIAQLVKERVFRSRDFVRIRWNDSLLHATKTRAGLIDVCRNRMGLVLRYPDDYARKLRWHVIPPGMRRRARLALAAFRKGDRAVRCRGGSAGNG